MASIILAYNDDDTIPEEGSQRITINVPYADDTKQIRVFDEVELLDKTIIHDVIGAHLVLEFCFGPAGLAENESFWRAFLSAPHTWAVYGDFKDVTNSENDNLCKCVIQETEVQISVEADLMDGYKLVSEKVF